MFRFKFTAVLITLLARLGLADPQYSILDESNNRWLPNDTLFTSLNTLYDGLSNALGENHDKKRRSTSLIAAALIEYLSCDLTDEQAKLNSTLNGLISGVDSKARTVVGFAGAKKVNDVKSDRGERENQNQRDGKMKSPNQSGGENRGGGGDRNDILATNLYMNEIITVDPSIVYKFDTDFKQLSNELKYPELFEPFSTLPF